MPGDAAPLRNANGCEEPHSKRPELWNIDGTELDMKGSYKVGGQNLGAVGAEVVFIHDFVK